MLFKCLGGISSGLKSPCFIKNLISILCSASKNYFNSSHFEKLNYSLTDKMTHTDESLMQLRYGIKTKFDTCSKAA